MSERTVSNLLARYDELVSLQVNDAERIETIVGQQSQVILAIDGLQPDVGHEVLWVVREVLSGEILLAKSLLPSTSEGLAPLLIQVKRGLSVPIVGVVSDGQSSIRKIDHFLKVTRSYAPGLFHCYDIEGLPRTNNDLEQMVGSWRHHQRRCTGRKVAPASLVVRGSVQIVAAIATQMRLFTAQDLATVSIAAWQSIRVELNRHQHKRIHNDNFAAPRLLTWLI